MLKLLAMRLHRKLVTNTKFSFLQSLRLYLLSGPRAWQFYRIDRRHPPRHTATSVGLWGKIRRTACIQSDYKLSSAQTYIYGRWSCSPSNTRWTRSTFPSIICKWKIAFPVLLFSHLQSVCHYTFPYSLLFTDASLQLHVVHQTTQLNCTVYNWHVP